VLSLILCFPGVSRRRSNLSQARKQAPPQTAKINPIFRKWERTAFRPRSDEQAKEKIRKELQRRQSSQRGGVTILLGIIYSDQKDYAKRLGKRFSNAAEKALTPNSRELATTWGNGLCRPSCKRPDLAEERGPTTLGSGIRESVAKKLPELGLVLNGEKGASLPQAYCPLSVLVWRPANGPKLSSTSFARSPGSQNCRRSDKLATGKLSAQNEGTTSNCISTHWACNWLLKNQYPASPTRTGKKGLALQPETSRSLQIWTDLSFVAAEYRKRAGTESGR